MTVRRFRLLLIVVAALCVAPTSVAAASDGCASGDFSAQRDSSNPLALPMLAHGLFSTNPLSGARFVVDHRKGLAIPDLRRHPRCARSPIRPRTSVSPASPATAAPPTC